MGHPAFGNLTPGGSAEFLAPTAGVIRALDLAVNEYQGGQDFVSAYETTSGQFQPGWPSPVNDLEFLSGPSVGDVNGLPGEEVVGGTASLDLYGFTQTGTPLPGFPKLTADWTVANPALGSLGTFDVDASARKVLVGLTRTGTLLAYDTDAPSCTPGSWPRFHHDNANSGDYNRDAVLPGKPYDIALDADNNITFKAPGDDLMCGNVDHYEVVQSNGTITPANFASQEPAVGCARADGTRYHPDHADPTGATSVRRRARGGRAGQRRPAGGHRDPELRAAEVRHPGGRAARAGVQRVRVAQPHARPAAQLPVVRSAAAGLLAADRRSPGCERQPGGVGGIGAA